MTRQTALLTSLGVAVLSSSSGQAMAQASAAVSGNPSATDYSVVGTGWLGRMLGLKDEWGVSLGGLWLADTDIVAAGGTVPGGWTNNRRCSSGCTSTPTRRSAGEARRSVSSSSSSMAAKPTSRLAASPATTAEHPGHQRPAVDAGLRERLDDRRHDGLLQSGQRRDHQLHAGQSLLRQCRVSGRTS
ncbi:MAG: hypothetical protein ACOY4R_05670 [Pseudomonadota bacterium]